MLRRKLEPFTKLLDIDVLTPSKSSFIGSNKFIASTNLKVLLFSSWFKVTFIMERFGFNFLVELGDVGLRDSPSLFEVEESLTIFSTSLGVELAPHDQLDS